MLNVRTAVLNKMTCAVLKKLQNFRGIMFKFLLCKFRQYEYYSEVTVFFLVLVYIFNFDLFEFSDAILEKGLLAKSKLHLRRGEGLKFQL